MTQVMYFQAATLQFQSGILVHECALIKCVRSNRDTWKKIVPSQRFLKTKDEYSSFFANGPIIFKGSWNYTTTKKVYKILFEFWPLRKQPSNLWMFLVHLHCKVTILIFEWQVRSILKINILKKKCHFILTDWLSVNGLLWFIGTHDSTPKNVFLWEK